MAEQLNIGINAENRAEISGILSATLADLFVLYSKTRAYHWNVKGINFYNLHKLFEEQFEALDGSIDEVAERIRALGFEVKAGLSNYVNDSVLKEDGKQGISDVEMIQNLLADHETVIRTLRKNVEKTAELGDAGTSDFLTGLMEAHEKTAWFLRAHIN
jgi:starvation-inducible DNA-binding protein